MRNKRPKNWQSLTQKGSRLEMEKSKKEKEKSEKMKLREKKKKHTKWKCALQGCFMEIIRKKPSRQKI